MRAHTAYDLAGPVCEGGSCETIVWFAALVMAAFLVWAITIFVGVTVAVTFRAKRNNMPLAWLAGVIAGTFGVLLAIGISTSMSLLFPLAVLAPFAAVWWAAHEKHQHKKHLTNPQQQHPQSI